MQIKGVSEPIDAREADLGKSSFVGVMLKEAQFEGLQSVRFDYVNMSDASFCRMNLSRSVFDVQPGVWFDNVNLAGSAIQNANLAGLSITNCNIAGLCVDGMLVSELVAAYRKSA
jgi:uncharacterized protein YjbI with pentapeptide repeats